MKLSKNRSNNNGFTIIEVALVLAIAGLIFLVVFLALPALQNSQKDTAAREAVGKVVSALESYEADNQGVYTSSLFTGALSGYYGKLPNGLTTHIYSVASEVMPTQTEIEVVYGALCGVNVSSATTPSNIFISSGSNTQNGKTVNSAQSVSAAIELSSGSYYCQSV